MKITRENLNPLYTEDVRYLYTEDGVPYETELRQDYVDQNLGSLVCWNMATFVDAEYASPDLNPDTFAPTGFDIDNWLAAIVSAGCKYAILTTKHHDGFALWPTAYHVPGHDPYSIAQTSWYAANGNPDVVDLFVSKCRTHGLAPGLYFSIRDQTYETRGNTTLYYNVSSYVNMIEAQLTELLTNYGTLKCIWFDGWGWDLGYDYLTYSRIYNFVKSLSPTTLVIENAHVHPSVTSQIETWEQNEGNIPDGNTTLAEAVQSSRIDLKWFYGVSADQSSAAYNLVDTQADILQANTNYGTYLLGTTPGTNGVLPPAQVTFLASIP